MIIDEETGRELNPRSPEGMSEFLRQKREAGQNSQPRDLAAEQVVLGAMMLDTDTLADISDIIRAGDFYKGAHTSIYQAVMDLYGRGEPTSPVAVAGHLLSTGDIQRIGGAPYLHECIAAVPTVANGVWHARRVADLAGRRRLIEAGTKIVQLGSDPELELPQALDQSGAAFFDATAAREENDLVPSSDTLQEMLDSIEKAAQDDGTLTGVPTGFVDLDRLLGGLQPGQLIVTAGRPGMGKSTFAVDVARCAVFRSNKNVAIFSLEMSTTELQKRILSAESKVPLSAIRSGKLTDDDWHRITPAMERMATRKLRINEGSALTVTDIRSRARRMAQRDGLDLIVVDYLQLMTPSGRKTDNRQQEVADMSRGLKLLAKELQVPVIAVAQLNRGVESRQDKRPMLSDLRESGALEQDADIVIMVHRDDYYDKECPRAGEADLIVAKHRNGSTDTITVASQLHLSRFADLVIA